MELIQKEVDAGWVAPFNGTLEEAQNFSQHGLGQSNQKLSGVSFDVKLCASTIAILCMLLQHDPKHPLANRFDLYRSFIIFIAG